MQFRPDFCRHFGSHSREESTNETPAYDWPWYWACAHRCILCRAGQRRRARGTLKKIKETGAITIGYRDSSIPFSYLDDNQKPIGLCD